MNILQENFSDDINVHCKKVGRKEQKNKYQKRNGRRNDLDREQNQLK